MASSSAEADTPQAIWLVEVGKDTLQKMIDHEITMLEAAIATGHDTVEHVWNHKTIWADGMVQESFHPYVIDIRALTQTNQATRKVRKLLRVA